MRNDAFDRTKLMDDLLDLVAKETMVDRAELALDAKLDELSIASADFMMILMAIEEEYGAYISVDNEVTDLKTVGDLLTLAIDKIAEAQG